MSEKHWNDELMALEAKTNMAEESIMPSIEAWDWRYRAEAAEAKLKEMETMMEQTKIAVYQIRNNFESIQNKQRALLAMCLKHLDPALFYYDLDTNPLVRQRQMNERTESKRKLVEALEMYLQSFPQRSKKGVDDDSST